jgi:hypothetical protein
MRCPECHEKLVVKAYGSAEGWVTGRWVCTECGWAGPASHFELPVLRDCDEVDHADA